MNTFSKPERGGRAKSRSPGRAALADVAKATAMADVWLMLAWHDVRNRFRRSVLGPLWITIAMATMVATLAVVLGTVLGQPMNEILPYVAAGLVFWGLLSGVITEATTTFIDAAGSIRNVAMPLSLHLFRMLARNSIVWLFNMTIFIAIAVIFLPPPTPALLLFLPGLVLFAANLWWMSLLAALLSARYRDIPQLVASVLQVLFFLTPIFWSPDRLPARPVFVTLNPLSYLFDVVRAPLLGTAIDPGAWIGASIMAVLGIALSLVVFRMTYARVPYWV